MRRVKITYEDGHIEEYESVKLAAQALRCQPSRIQRMEGGKGGVLMRAHGIASVETSEPVSVSKRGRKAGGRPVCVRCINEQTGEVIETKSIKEAIEKTNGGNYVFNKIGDGLYHNGWKYEQIPDDDPECDKGEWLDPVPDDLIKTIYTYAWHYLKRCWRMPEEDKQDVVQHIVNRVASDYSTRLYERYKTLYPLNVWLTMRVVHWGCGKVHKWYRDNVYRRAEFPEGLNCEPEDWLEWQAGGKEDDHRVATLLEEMPEKYRELARLMLEGRNKTELMVGLGLPDNNCKIAQLKRELGEWLKKWMGRED